METERRAVLAAGAACAAAALSGCQTYGKQENTQVAPATETVLGKITEVPVGGSKIFKEAKVIVSQPTEGTFTALTAVCTHQGCLVNKILDGKASCPCHGSEFSLADGSVTKPPANAPLTSVKVKASGENLVLLPN
ncbi:Rieske (2Fe-2S) protein [Actinocorallia lasiicapitis]